MSLPSDTVQLGEAELPPVMLQLAQVLPLFEGEALEGQLQSFDTFLDMLGRMARPKVAQLLAGAAEKTEISERRARIQAAADAVARGERAAAPYDHEASMRAYREAFRKEFPQADVPEPKHPRDERDEEI